MQSVRVRWFHPFPKPLRYARHTRPNKPLAQNPQEKWQNGGGIITNANRTLCPIQSALALSLHHHISHHPQIGKNKKRQQNCKFRLNRPNEQTQKPKKSAWKTES